MWVRGSSLTPAVFGLGVLIFQLACTVSEVDGEEHQEWTCEHKPDWEVEGEVDEYQKGEGEEDSEDEGPAEGVLPDEVQSVHRSQLSSVMSSI